MLTLAANVGETRNISNLDEVIEIKVLSVDGNRVMFGVRTIPSQKPPPVSVPTDIAFLQKQAD